MTPALDIDAVAVKFGGVQAVAGVSCTIARGEMVGLIGPNGAGKTTTVRTLGTLLAPSSGP